MSRHRAPWLLLAVACATTSRSTYNQTRATEYVYAGSPDAVLVPAARLLADRGLKPARVDARTVQTPWAFQGVQSPGRQTQAEYFKGPEPHTYQSYRVVATSVDGMHQTVRIERLTITAVDTVGRQSARTRPVAAVAVAANATPMSAQQPEKRQPQQSSPTIETPEGVANPAAIERQPAMEWELLQRVDPTAALVIEQEPTVTSGCGQVRAPAPAPAPVLQIAASCPDVPGAIDLLASRRLIVLGELHGTEQSPAFVGNLACGTAAEGWPLAVALELPQQDNVALQIYLGSQGTASDRQTYIATASWQRDWQDGRSSAAMFAVVEQLRALKFAGATLEVQGIDDRRLLGPDREAAMATFVDAMRRRLLDRPMVVLVGNVHAQTRPGQVTADYLPLSARLDRFGLKPVALVMAYDAGTMWGCTLEAGYGCGVHPVKGWPPKGGPTYHETASQRFSKMGGMGSVGDPAPDAPRVPRSIKLWPHRSDGFDGQYFLGAITASRPP